MVYEKRIDTPDLEYELCAQNRFCERRFNAELRRERRACLLAASGEPRLQLKARRMAVCNTQWGIWYPLHKPWEARPYPLNPCRSSLCDRCRAYDTRRKVAKWVKVVANARAAGKRIVGATLTHSNREGESHEQAYGRFIREYESLVRRRAWKSIVFGWFVGREITRTAKSGLLHPHCHLVLALNSLSLDEVALNWRRVRGNVALGEERRRLVLQQEKLPLVLIEILERQWRLVTGEEGVHLDAKELRANGASGEEESARTLNYLGKAIQVRDEDIVEFASLMHGQPLLSSGGEFRGHTRRTKGLGLRGLGSGRDEERPGAAMALGVAAAEAAAARGDVECVEAIQAVRRWMGQRAREVQIGGSSLEEDLDL